MKLEEKFYNSFFFPFLAGTLLSIFVSIFFIANFTVNYINYETGIRIIELEKKYAQINLNSVNILLTNTIVKIQLALNEQIEIYSFLSKKIINLSKEQIKKKQINNYTRCFLDLNNESNFTEVNKDLLDYVSFWFVNETINEKTIEDDNHYLLKSQLLAYSGIIKTLNSVLKSLDEILMNIYFLFERTDLIINFPLSYFHKNKLLKLLNDFNQNPTWCTNSTGEVIKSYRFKCRSFYTNINAAKEDKFDLNVNKQTHRKIFISPPYLQAEQSDNDLISTACIQFNDTISNENAYICGDFNVSKMFRTFDTFNEKLRGYFIISSVGYNKAFYYPEMFQTKESQTITENIFRWEREYFLAEKANFSIYTSKLLTSNLYSYINEEELESNPISILKEIYINGNNSEGQYFYLNNSLSNFSIYPIILENLEKKKEHVLSIVYFYNKELFFNNYFSYQKSTDNSTIIRIIIQAIFFFLAGSILLFLVFWSIKFLAKYIVIPIKNVNYMLKGINLGGVNRLDYLDSLYNKREKNIEKIKKIIIKYSNEKKKIDLRESRMDRINEIQEDENEKKNNINEKYEILSQEDNQENNKEENTLNYKVGKNIGYERETINKNIKDWEKESEIIENEVNYYDFDEELLQFRSLEIEKLVQTLIALKGALLLTSTEHKMDKIVDYSNSEALFSNYKNQEGSTICQSNIGNLQSQLLRYDKAIFHLVVSLQNVKLKKYLSRVLNDEFDECDELLHKIQLFCEKNRNLENGNILAEKQQKQSGHKFSKKVIGVLINSRYCKLIDVYFKFFTFIKKSNYDYEELSGYFMHTKYHTINYFHKTLIQYVFLCYEKKDFIKIGESILDYIEFLIKFKFKSSKNTGKFLNIYKKDKPGFIKIQETKKKIFDKIIEWISLFEIYKHFIKHSTSLADDKNIISEYEKYGGFNNDFNKGSHSFLLFKGILQRGDFLKGKFALECKNYPDAFYYFIRAAERQSFALDGLIKKKALNNIFKITKKLRNKLRTEKLVSIKNLRENKNFKQTRNRSGRRRFTNKYGRESYFIANNLNYEKEKEKELDNIDLSMEMILKEIKKDINKVNTNKLKDILVILDFSSYCRGNEIEDFKYQAKKILTDYLEGNDRYCLFLFFEKSYIIICPLIDKQLIDFNILEKDLTSIINKKVYKYSDDSFTDNDGGSFRDGEKEVIDLNIERVIDKGYEEGDGLALLERDIDSNQEEDKYEENLMADLYEEKFGGGEFNLNPYINKIKDEKSFENVLSNIISHLNYSMNYLIMKGLSSNEKYLFYFTNIFNIHIDVNEKKLNKELNKLKTEKDINFFFIGNIDLTNLNQCGKEIINEAIKKKFSQKSEIIDYIKMDKIQNILPKNNVIHDKIIFPNEIYK